MTDQEQQEIQESILERFDFESVRALMLINRWTYDAGETDAPCPTVQRLRDVATQLFYSLWRQARDNTRCSTGGFVLTRFIWDTSTEIELAFCWQRTGETISN